MSEQNFLELLRELNVKRCESPDGFNHKLTDWSLNDWTVAVCGEVGELANLAKKRKRFADQPFIKKTIQANSVTLEELSDEIADVFIYLDLLCASLGLNLQDVIARKFNKKSVQINYPFLLPSSDGEIYVESLRTSENNGENEKSAIIAG